MSNYFCYIHTTGNLTPQLRVVEATGKDDFVDRVTDVLREWPSFEMVDVYDRRDKLILRMGPGEAPHVN